MGVLVETSAHGPLHFLTFCVFAVFACCYVGLILPRVAELGRGHWEAAVAAGVQDVRPGGPYAEVSWVYTMFLSLAYVGTTFSLAARMAQRPAPVRRGVFECMAVHNLTQTLLNLYCFVSLLQEGVSLGIRAWGNDWDTSPRSYNLGRIMWLQYHCRWLQMLDTFFMVIRKKFKGLSGLHLYLRVLNLWGWYIACRYVCGGDSFFPAVVSAGCQSLVYGTYLSCSIPVAGSRGAFQFRERRITQLNQAQYVLCAAHSLLSSAMGNFPASLAVFHLFVIANGLVLYTDFHSLQPGDTDGDSLRVAPGETRRVTFSFDSSGWLMVYHFGVGTFLREALKLPGPGSDADLPNVGFSGSSGGSLVATVLGAGMEVSAVFEYVVAQFPECRQNPLRMFAAVERALHHFKYEGAHLRLSKCVRCLLTRITLFPPFAMGEVADHFKDLQTAIDICVASCHVPILAGVCPRRIGGRYYYDGLVWPSRVLVPWRGRRGDLVVRISACGNPFSDVAISPVPFWWAVMPPSEEALRGLYWCGYRDVVRWFNAVSTAADSPKSGDGAASPQNLSDNVAAWRLVREMAQRQGDGETTLALPETDPVTQQPVQELIRKVEQLAAWQHKIFLRALAAALSMIFLAAFAHFQAFALAAIP